MRFFDASALVKRYIRERGSMRVRRLLEADDVGICRLSELEIVSAFSRMASDGAISLAQRDAAAAAFAIDLSSWTIVELQPEVMRTARRLLLQHALRAGAAAQLGAALVLQRELARPLEEFVAYDTRLLNAAGDEQLAVKAR